jgi:hypothetical protein
VDVSQPGEPRLLGHVRGLRFVYSAVLQDDVAYVAGGRGGLILVDISDLENTRVVGVVRNLGFVSDVALTATGDLYVLDQDGGRLHFVATNSAARGSNGGY